MLRWRPIPFALVAPATIIFFGAAVTLVSTLVGLRELSSHAENSAAFQAEVLSDAFSARLASAPASSYERMLSATAQRSHSLLLIIDDTGTVRLAAPNQPFSQKALGALILSGSSVTIAGHRYFYRSSPIEGQKSRLFAFALSPDIEARESALISSMLTFALLLLAAAGFVGWALARDVHADVVFVRDTIVSMAKDNGPVRTEAIPVRSLDQVGELTSAFNRLLERFQAAKRAYRQDLSEARSFEEDRAAFLAALSHELRTPLNAILGFTDVLLDEIDGPLSPESRENLTIVRTSGEHLRSLIDDILTLSALESGEFSLSRERVPIATIAHDVVTESRVTATQKNLELHIDIPDNEDITTAYADRRRLRQVLGNVIGNAVKFTSTGAITVTIFKEGQYVVITVSDTGPGIAQEQLEAIFEEFRQAESSNPQRVGTGLGLSISRRLVQMHGGSIRAKSRLGEGSTFTIRIPIEPISKEQSSTIPPRQEPVIYDF